MRKRVGMRRHRASFYRHNGEQAQSGQVLLDDPTKWVVIAADWPCEFVSTVGGEILRGRMVTEKSTHVLFGHFPHVESVDAQCKVIVAGVEYGITSISDPEGLRTEMRIELRKWQ